MSLKYHFKDFSFVAAFLAFATTFGIAFLIFWNHPVAFLGNPMVLAVGNPMVLAVGNPMVLAVGNPMVLAVDKLTGNDCITDCILLGDGITDCILLGNDCIADCILGGRTD
jgi:hypothetical protein